MSYAAAASLSNCNISTPQSTRMNSLTTVGDTVIDATDMQINYHAELPEKKRTLHAGPRPGGGSAGRSGRMNVRRGRSVNEAHNHSETSFAFPAADVDVIDSLDETMIHSSSTKDRAATLTSMDQASLSRQYSSPAAADAATMTSRVAVIDNEHSTPRPRSYLNRTPTSPPFKNKDDRFVNKQTPYARDDSIEPLHPQKNSPRSPTIPQFPSSHLHDETKKSILSVLYDISKSDPYASSEYFRQLFIKGILNVERHKNTNREEGGEIRNIQDALRKCFGINEDLIRAIADDGIAIMEKKRDKDEPLFENEGRKDGGDNDDYEVEDKSTVADIAVNSRVSSLPTSTRHSELKSTTHKSHPSHPTSQFLTPTDLSGYTQKSYRKNGGLKSPKPTPSLALALPLPSTPLNLGRQQHSPSSHTQYFERNTASSSQSATFHFDEVLSNRPVIPEIMNTPSSCSERIEHSSYALQEYADATNQNNEKACSRVQQYLQQLEERIESVKKSHNTTVIAGQRSDHDSSVGIKESPRCHARTEDLEWNDDEPEEKNVVQSSVKKQLLLPSLLSHVNKNNGVREAPVSTVAFRANHAPDDTKMDVPLDETRGQHRQKDMYCTGTPSVTFSPHDNNHNNTEEKVRAAEKAVGLKSLQEYKQLLKERTMELEGLEHKYKTQLEQAERELEGQDEQVKQFRLAMKEAGVTVVALEETIQSLEEAVNEKDDLIAELEFRVKSLETELEQSHTTRLEGEIQHLETVTVLNNNISHMGMDIKEKENSLSEFQTKTVELEAKLGKALEQLATSQTDLADAQKRIFEQDLKLQVSENELLSTKEMLHGHIELYKNEISSSLQNATRLMDLMTKEKDNLIESLNAKIAMLEESLAEVEEEKEASSKIHDEKVKELNDALTQKDEQIAILQKEKKSSGSRRPASSSSSHNRFRKRDERLHSQHRRHNETRWRYVPIINEEYYEPHHDKRKHPFGQGRYYERTYLPRTREDEEYEAINGSDEQYYHSATSPRSRYYNNEARDDEAEVLTDDDEYYTTRHRHRAEGIHIQYPLSADDDYTFDGDSIYDFS